MVNNDAGKGSQYRPVNKAKYDANFEAIFGKTSDYTRFKRISGCTYYSKGDRKMVTIPKIKRT